MIIFSKPAGYRFRFQLECVQRRFNKIDSIIIYIFIFYVKYQNFGLFSP